MFQKISDLKYFAILTEKKPVLKSHFNEAAGLGPATFLKIDSNIGVCL